jgi:thiamine pyrophosphate-dependent acetolactate synthase large subunit-like protein
VPSTSTSKPRVAASYDNAKVVNRFGLTKRLVAKLKKDEAVIGGVGNTNFDLWSAGRRPQNFYMLGSMGLAIPIALGVALAQPRRHVIALEGDGSLLMQLGCLTTIAALKPVNLTMVVMDNGLYQITGGQPTPAAGIADYVAFARAAGLTKCAWATDEEDFEGLIDLALAEGGPTFIAARIDDKPGVGRHRPRPRANPRALHARARGEKGAVGTEASRDAYILLDSESFVSIRKHLMIS